MPKLYYCLILNVGILRKMGKEEIKKKLEEFFKQRMASTKSLDELCKENGIRKYKKKHSTVWGKRTLENRDTHWDNLNLDEYSFDKPVIVCLSGNGTKSTKGANGMCKIAENMLDLMFKMKDSEIKAEDKIDIISCSYDVDLKYLFYPIDDEVKEKYPDLKEYAKEFPEALWDASQRGYLSDATSKQFAKNILFSRCINEDGEKLPIDECQKNISQVTFFTYCYGTKALNQIMDYFTGMLLQKGFNEKEIDKITSSMSHVSFARLVYTGRVPTTYFYAVNDRNLNTIKPLLKGMEGSGSQLETRLSRNGGLTFGQDLLGCVFYEKNNTESLEFAYMGIEKDKDEVVVGQDREHYLINMDRNEDWDIINKKKGIYNAISQMMSWALCRAVENGLDNANSDKYIPKISMEQLQDELLNIYQSFSKDELMTKQQ